MHFQFIFNLISISMAAGRTKKFLGSNMLATKLPLR